MPPPSTRSWLRQSRTLPLSPTTASSTERPVALLRASRQRCSGYGWLRHAHTVFGHHCAVWPARSPPTTPSSSFPLRATIRSTTSASPPIRRQPRRPLTPSKSAPIFPPARPVPTAASTSGCTFNGTGTIVPATAIAVCRAPPRSLRFHISRSKEGRPCAGLSALLSSACTDAPEESPSGRNAAPGVHQQKAQTLTPAPDPVPARTIESNHDQGHLLSSSRRQRPRPMTGWRASLPPWVSLPARDGTKQESRGAAFLAPLGNLEFVDGQFPSTADVLVEVTALDAVHQAAEPGSARRAATRRWPASRTSPRRTGSRASSPSSPSPAFPSASGPGPIPSKASP